MVLKYYVQVEGSRSGIDGFVCESALMGLAKDQLCNSSFNNQLCNLDGVTVKFNHEERWEIR